MATTSLSLGSHWTEFIRREVESGRYGSASEVLRDGLRGLENRNKRLDALRAHLAEGAEQSAQERFVEDFSMTKVLDHAEPKA